MTSTRTDISTHRRPRTAVRWSTDLVVVGAAIACALVAWLFTAGLAGVDLAVVQGDQLRQIGGLAVAITAGVAATAGVISLRILERLTSKAVTVWTWAAVVVTLGSLLGPLSATSAAATGMLACLHGVVAAVVIVALRRSRRRSGAVTRARRT